MSKRVLCAMSGGVDSSAAALLLCDAGYDVTGVTLRLASDGERDIADAASVCRTIGIPHVALDMQKDFRSLVELPFCEAYLRGETPNPCITCNKYIKFGLLLDYADENGYEMISTGHYVGKTEYRGHTLLRRADDEKKDQSYVLWQLPESTVQRTLFPLCGLKKPEIRALTEARGLVTAARSDSQDICFVPDGNYVSFIEEMTGTHTPPGNYIDASGRVLGTHLGHVRYTVGQRKGLGIALGEPAFVTAKDPAANTVTLGKNAELFKREITVRDAIISNAFPLPGCFKVKLRYAHKAADAEVSDLGDGRLRIVFDEPQRAPARGQSAVVYFEDLLCGGGFIE